MNEELEKIAQDMRRKERELWAGNPPRMGNGAVALMLDGYASRLEVALGLAPRPKCEAAATEREMAKGLSKKLDGNRAIPGNAAEMRKALERILDIEGYGAPWIEAKVIAQKALEGEQCTPPIAQESPKIEQQGNAAEMRKALEDTEELLEHFAKPGTMLHSAFFLHMRDNRAALAEPPRNCDRFQTASEVSAYWNSNVRTVPLPHDAYGMRIDGETYPTFLDWLMAPAEGGSR